MVVGACACRVVPMAPARCCPLARPVARPALLAPQHRWLLPPPQGLLSSISGDKEEDKDQQQLQQQDKDQESRIKSLEKQIEQVVAQLEQMSEASRERDTALAVAIKNTEASIRDSSTDGGSMDERVQRAKAEGDVGADILDGDGDKAWDNFQDAWCNIMSKGYLQSVDKIRERLMLTEWVLHRKDRARRQGVAAFERHCAESRAPIEWETMTALYDDPSNLELIDDPHQRMQLRAAITNAVESEHEKVYQRCTMEAQKLAQQFSQGELIGKLLPESGVVDMLKSLVPAAIKMVV